MESIELRRRVREAARTTSWNEFVTQIRPVERAMVEAEAYGAGARSHAYLAEALVEIDRNPQDDRQPGAIIRTLIPDLFSILRSPTALSIGMAYQRQRITFPSDVRAAQDPWEATLRSIARGIGAVPSENENDALLEHLIIPVSLPSSTINFEAGGDFRVKVRGEEFYCSSHSQINAGDVLLREMSLSGFARFGHAAIYIGPKTNDCGAEESKLLIVEMQAGPSGGQCRITDLASFKKAGAYWGAYSVGLTQMQRSLVASTALSFVGVATYGFLQYKDPVAPRFRCDGLVEHCYETLAPQLPSGLGYRGGLFEEDRWDLISPAALRSCFYYKTR